MLQKQNDEEGESGRVGESSSEKNNKYICQQMNANVVVLGTVNNPTVNTVSSLHRKNTFVRVTT